MLNKLMDVHNHTTWSDGVHAPEEIIENAIKHGIDIIGISDHFDTTKCRKSVTAYDLKQYIETLELLKYKYKDKIKMQAGIEICMKANWCQFNNLPYDTLNMLDYVLFEYVDLFPDSVKLKEIKEYTSKVTCKKGLAHTDLLDLTEKYGMDYVIKTLKDNDLFWEINVNPGYPYFKDIIRNKNKDFVKEFFKKLEESEILITVGSDIHILDSFDIEKVRIGNQMAQYNYIK